ncbi:MMPL family transporter [Testudinibacter sp. P80/BLE/0925]|uniref:MMPL family transporter n=1 Tax=Testudinibacter sp. TW-1 TaxID=3417757 RepID=UPI003D35EB75
MSLLPSGSQPILQRQAIAKINQQLNHQIIALIGATDKESAVHLTKDLVDSWQHSNLFQRIDWQAETALTTLSQNLTALRLAALPTTISSLPAHDFLLQRAKQIADPFAISMLPLAQDWLGFGNAVLNRITDYSKVELDLGSNTFQVQDQDKTWLLVRGILYPAATTGLLDLLKTSQQQIQLQHGDLLLTGGAIYTALGEAQGEQESRMLSMIGITAMLLILWLAFRTLRLLYLILPMGLGLASGAMACILIFGKIHLLTLVIGTSLIGLAMDFPLHWLVHSWREKWRAFYFITTTWKPFAIGLFTTVIGYLMLLWTPLTILQQTAVFSIFALLSAFCCSLWVLPFFFAKWQPKPTALLPDLATQIRLKLEKFWQFITPKKYWAIALLCLFSFINPPIWHDDIRDWISTSPQWLKQAKDIADKTGINPTGQFFIVQADNETALLDLDANVAAELEKYKQQGKLGDFNAISQFVNSTEKQREIQQNLAKITEFDQDSLLAQLGVPLSAWQREIQQLQQLKPLDISTALASPLAERWANLWLGEQQGQVASMITLNHLIDIHTVARIAEQFNNVQWVDYRQNLNQTFNQARWQAGGLKLASFLLVWLLLWRAFGRTQATKIIAVPLVSVVLTILTLGWLNVPIGLFSIFGLLLSSAIGVDYAIYAQLKNTPQHWRLNGVFLAAATTVISFGLLAASQTAAVAHFGLSVSIGIGWNLLLAVKLNQTSNFCES